MKILFATDGGKRSNAVIDLLARIVSDGDEIHIVSVVDIGIPTPVDIYGSYIPDTSELEKVSRENAQRVIAETETTLRSRLNKPELNINGEVLFGSPQSRIVEKAQEIGADLVAIGSHNYSGLERLILGSVSGSVVNHSQCSVLVVKSQDEE